MAKSAQLSPFQLCFQGFPLLGPWSSWVDGQLLYILLPLHHHHHHVGGAGQIGKNPSNPTDPGVLYMRLPWASALSLLRDNTSAKSSMGRRLPHAYLTCRSWDLTEPETPVSLGMPPRPQPCARAGSGFSDIP